MICTTIKEEYTFHVDDVIATPNDGRGTGSLWMFAREKEGKSFVLALPIVTPIQRARTLQRTVLSIRKKCNSQLCSQEWLRRLKSSKPCF